MSEIGAPTPLPAPGFERPDYTAFAFPAASLVDGATEEIELDQALSLTDRRGRDFLGWQFQQVLAQMQEEHLTASDADLEQRLVIQLNSRTGNFGLQDPEQLAISTWAATLADVGTSIGLVAQEIQTEHYKIGEAELFVAPRLFFRVVNDLDQTLAVDDLHCRVSSVSRRLSFQLFIELLERFADVTLL